MVKLYIKSRTFWIMFFFVFLAVALVALGVLLFSWQRSMSQALKTATSENEQAVITMSEYLDDMLEDAVVLSGALLGTEWVQKLCVEKNVFDSSFDYVRKREIASDFLFHVTKSGVVDRRFLVYPYKDAAIGERVYADISSYFGILGVPRAQRSVLLDEIAAVRHPSLLYTSGLDSGTLLVCLPVENIERSRLYLISVINKGRLSQGLADLMPGGVVGVRVIDNKGETLLRLGGEETGGNVTLTTRAACYINWQYEFFLDSSIATVVYTQTQRWLSLGGVVICTLTLLVAGAAATVLYHPVASLLTHAGLHAAPRTPVRDDYRALGEHIVSMNEIARESRRTAMLTKLLSGYFHTEDQQLASIAPDFHDQSFYKVILCRDDVRRGQGDTRHDVRGYLDEIGVVYETLDGIDETLIAVMAFETREAAHTFPAQALAKRLAGRASLFVGATAAGLTGVGISYQSAKEKRQHLSGAAASRYYLPLEWESQFLEALFSGSVRVACDILHEVRRENERRQAAGLQDADDGYRLIGVLIHGVRRVMQETAHPDGTLENSLTALADSENQADVWAHLQEICTAICERVNAGKHSEDGKAQKIFKYIDEHAGDAGLSLTVLEDAFSMSTGTINKCIREASGMTFYAYLTKVRMERARMLLAGGEQRVACVARAVGYDSEYSFRRAFLRHTGTRAQEYAAAANQESVLSPKEDA